MEIKVLGTGCSSCKTLYETTKQAISELGSDGGICRKKIIPIRSERIDNPINYLL